MEEMLEAGEEMDWTHRHLYVELARLDLLIHRRVAAIERSSSAMALQRVENPLHMSADEAYVLLQQPFGQSMPGMEDDEEGERETPILEALEEVERQIGEVVQQAAEVGEGSRLVQLAIACNLSRLDLDAFLICLAPALDLRYERLYGFLNDDLTRRRATVNLILDLLCEPGAARMEGLAQFEEGSRLFDQRLVEPVTEPGIVQPVLLNQGLAVDSAIVTWLLGKYRPAAALANLVVFTKDPVPVHTLYSDALRETIESVCEYGGMLALTGKDNAAHKDVMSALAAVCESPLITLDMAAVVRQEADLHQTLAVFLRDVRLTGAVAGIVGWEACLQDGSPAPRVFEVVDAHVGPLVVASDVMWRPHLAKRSRRIRWIDTPALDYGQRSHLLSELMEGLASDTPIDIAEVAGRFVLTTGQLRDMVDSALDRSTQAGRGLLTEDLYAAAREHSSPRLSTLARKLSQRYTWDDLVLPDDQVTRLRELVQMVRGRAQVLDAWGLGQKLASSYGITALFAGSPGTGKTMAAEVLARDLGLDVYKIDLSGLVSKYIGETEKNLERVFSEAESSNAILFFDEADAVFGKRSEVKDAHDRYANIETSYLLQRMEAYDGVTILATNLRSNLDEAFTRRLDVIVDFPFPDAAQRANIWKALFPSGAPRGEDVDLELMAKRFKVAGGSIRNILVAAAYLAAANDSPLDMSHLLHATRREMQKLGRLTDERDFTV
jgi:ATP-dependent 26S proteasome regulatory subunit